MHDNVQYGFDPHDDSDYLTIADNKVYGNGNHGEKMATILRCFGCPHDHRKQAT